MATAPIAVGQAPVSATRNTEGGNSSASQINSSNQQDKSNFPRLMKKMKDEGEDKGRGKKEDDSKAPLVRTGIQSTDTALPPTGIQLPLTLVHTPDSSRPDGAVTDNQSTAAALPSKLPLPVNNLKGEGAKKSGKGNEHADIPVSGKDSTAVHTDRKVVGNAAINAAQPPLTHDESQTADKSDFSALLAPVRNDHPGVPILNRDLASGILEKHTALVDASSHMPHDGANGVSGLMQGTTDRPGQTPAVPPPISVPLKNSQWGDDVSNRVMWMIQHDVQAANIKINPPHLGPLEIHVSMHKDHVDVSFNSHHATVKEALDASMPKLKEMMGNSGLQLGNADVTHHSFSGQSQYNNQGANHQYVEDGGQPLNVSAVDDDAMTKLSIPGWDVGSGAIDFYA
jgi:flagellar hook-length control protein FliK